MKRKSNFSEESGSIQKVLRKIQLVSVKNIINYKSYCLYLLDEGK